LGVFFGSGAAVVVGAGFVGGGAEGVGSGGEKGGGGVEGRLVREEGVRGLR